MTRRELPPRTTRGQKPKNFDEDDKIYERLLTRSIPAQDQAEIERKQREAVRKNNFLLNIKKYPYGRAVHYFHQLDIFPRVHSSPSYAFRLPEISPDKFSGAKAQILGGKIDEVLNRVMLGLPAVGSEPKKESKSKNICHGYLNAIEDKKYNSDKVLSTYRGVLKNLDKLVKDHKLEQFAMIKKDSELEPLLDGEVDLQEKRRLLTRRIQSIEDRRQTNWALWEQQDFSYYYHSLNQILHNQVTEYRRQFALESLISLLFGSANPLIEHFSNGQTSNFVSKMVGYYQTGIMAVTQQSIKHLHQKFDNLKRKFTKAGQPLVNFPVVILNFGGQKLLSLVNFVLARRLNSNSETNFYLAKQAWRKLFRSDFILHRQERPISYDQYSRLAKRRIEQMKKFYKGNNQQNMESSKPLHNVLLDELINWKEFKKPSDYFTIFKKQDLVEINAKEYLYIMMYHWICRSFAEIYDFAVFNQGILEVIGSQFYPKFCNFVVEVMNSPLVGVLNSAIEALVDYLARPDPFTILGFKLFFQFDKQRSVGMIWKRSIKGEDEIKLQRSNERSFVNLELGNPKKRVKMH